VGEMVGKGPEDEWVVTRLGITRDIDAVAFRSPIEAMIIGGAIWGVAESSKHVEDSVLSKGVEGGFATFIPGMEEHICYAEFSVSMLEFKRVK
jgi:hypothetical protein